MRRADPTAGSSRPPPDWARNGDLGPGTVVQQHLGDPGNAIGPRTPTGASGPPGEIWPRSDHFAPFWAHFGLLGAILLGFDKSRAQFGDPRPVAETSPRKPTTPRFAGLSDHIIPTSAGRHQTRPTSGLGLVANPGLVANLDLVAKPDLVAILISWPTWTSWPSRTSWPSWISWPKGKLVAESAVVRHLWPQEDRMATR